MALNNPTSGILSVNEFQASPLPWVLTAATSGTSVIEYDFPRVTKCITISNLSAGKTLRIGFTLNGVNGVNGKQYFILSGSTSVTLDCRVKELYLRADTSNTIDFSIYAGLTTIASREMPILSGSLPDGSPGWSGVG